MVDSSGSLWIDNGKGIQLLGPTGPHIEPVITELAKKAWVTNSGATAFLAVAQKDGITRLGAVSLRGDYLPIGSFPGPLLAVSWNTLGLAAIIGPNLVIWPSGSQKLLRLISDDSLLEAQDVCLVSNRRAVVSLKGMTVLVSEQSRLVLVGFGSRPRFSDSHLFLADQGSNVVWEVSLPDELGKREADEAHARDLLARVDPAGVPKSSMFLEAARILGCRNALEAVNK